MNIEELFKLNKPKHTPNIPMVPGPPAISTSAGASASNFGHQDMYAAQQAGTDPRVILAFLNANPDKLSQDNKPGAGGVYDIISQQAVAAQTADKIAESNSKLAEQRAKEIQRQEQLRREAEARQVERLKQMEIGARTEAANKARADLQSKFQISSASKSPQTSGTQAFKRRQLQVNPMTYNALTAGIQNQGTLPGVINV